MEGILFEVAPVDVGDLQLAAGGRIDRSRDVDHAIIVEIKAGDRVVGLRLTRLFLDAHGLTVFVERDHAVTLGIGDAVAEHSGADRSFGGAFQIITDRLAEEDIVAEHQGAVIIADEVAADQEGLGEALGLRLHRIVEGKAPLAAVAEQLLKNRLVLGRGDHQNVADAGQHQGADRKVDHRLVEYREQLLAHRSRHRMEAGAGAACENNALPHGRSIRSGSNSMPAGRDWNECRPPPLVSSKGVARQMHRQLRLAEKPPS